MSTHEVVIIGKSFEDTTLEDGSQQIIEKTRYKRLIDGYIWTESNVIQLNDIEDIMGNTGIEDEPQKKQAPTWSMSLSSSDDAADLDGALSTSPDGDQGDAAGRQMCHVSMNVDPPALTPKYNLGGWGGRLFSPAMSIDEESAVHPSNQNHKRTFFRASDACDGDDSVAVTNKKNLQRKRRRLLLFLYSCLIIAGVAVAAVMLQLWLTHDSANQAPENTDAGDELSGNTAADTLDSVTVDTTVGNENVEAGNTEQVDIAEDEEVSDSTSVVEEAATFSNTADNAVAPCIQLKITTEADKESTDLTLWKLTRAGEGDSTITIGAADVLSSDGSNNFDECVDPGVYTFHISDSGGDGLGERGKTGYVINADGIDFGVSTWFLHDEKMTFSLPLVDDINTGYCSDDFLLVIKTDDKPEETRWDVVNNDNGETVLRGGPYFLPQSIHTQRACLSDGSYTFNIHDSGGDGVCCNAGKGFFSLYRNGVEVVDSNGQYGNNNSAAFVLSSP